MKNKLFFLILIFSISINIFGKEKLDEKPKEKKELNSTSKNKKKVNYAIIPGPSYNPTTGFGLTLIPVAIYDLYDPGTTRPSSSKLYLNGTETKTYMSAFLQEVYFEDNKWKLDFGLGKGTLRTKYYGMKTTPSDDYVWKKNKLSFAGFRLMRQVVNDLYIGGTFLSISSNPEGDDEEAQEWLDRDGVKGTQNTSLGLNVLYDTRDNIFYPKTGINLKVNSNFYMKSIGSSNDYNTIEVDYSQYKSLDKTNKSVLAWNIYEYSALGDVPAGVGYKSPGKLRGYMYGKYMGTNLLITQLEYRRKFNKKIGFTVFGGAAKVFNSFDKLGEAELLPSGGVGLRYTVIPSRGMNARLDFVHSKDGGAVYFSVGEAF